jgi:hypothetical protein
LLGIVADKAGAAARPAGHVARPFEPSGPIPFRTPAVPNAVEQFAILIAVEQVAAVLFPVGDKHGLLP